jgi:hypothetical protein
MGLALPPVPLHPPFRIDSASRHVDPPPSAGPRRSSRLHAVLVIDPRRSVLLPDNCRQSVSNSSALHRSAPSPPRSAMSSAPRRWLAMASALRRRPLLLVEWPVTSSTPCRRPASSSTGRPCHSSTSQICCRPSCYNSGPPRSAIGPA